MRTPLTLISTLIPLAIACGTQTQVLEKDVPPDNVPTVEAPDCDGMARVLSPASDGQSDFYFLDDISFEVNKGAEEAEITVLDADGESVPGSTWIDSVIHRDGWTSIVFTPDSPLAPSTPHTATLNYCGGLPSVGFTTSTLGTPLDTPEDMTGRTFQIDLSAARITQPSQVAQALLSLVDHNLMVQVDHAEESNLDMTIGAANKLSGLQDTCMPTISVSVDGDFTGAPTFAMGPIDVDFALAGYSVTFFDAVAEATFAQDGTYFAGGRLSGTLDARDVIDALSGRDVLPSDDPSDICEIISRVGLECTACSDGEEVCLGVEVHDVKGEFSINPVQSISQFDCHEDCEDSCDNDECEAAEELQVCL